MKVKSMGTNIITRKKKGLITREVGSIYQDLKVLRTFDDFNTKHKNIVDVWQGP